MKRLKSLIVQIPFTYYLFHYGKKIAEGYSLNEIIGKDNKREKRIRGGKKNPKKKFLIIRFWYPGKNWGFFAYWTMLMGFIKQADDRGMIPIIDMKNWKTSIAGDDFPDTVNTWELYYKQYGDFTLEEVYESKNVYICEKFYAEGLAIGCKKGMIEGVNRKIYHDLFKKYLNLSIEAEEKIKANIGKMLKGRILGVAIRGSGYLTNRPEGHAIQPEVSEVIQKVKESMATWNCDRIFLSTEDAAAVRQMVEAFGDKIFYYQRTRNNERQGKQECANQWSDNPSEPGRIHDRYYMNLDYICEMYTLAHCTCLIGSMVNGTIAALIMNGNQYEHEYIFDKGVY